MGLKVNEIYKSVQGESTYTGHPCVFIRLTYCNLRCSYCDTEYAFYEGKELSIEEILEKIKAYKINLVEVTGGEPLIQKECNLLLKKLLSHNYEVLLETSGSLTLAKVPNKVIKIVDFKCPSSKMESKNLWENVNYINKKDEIKFVIGNRKDYNWAKKKITEHKLFNLTKNILFSPVFNEIEPKKIIDWILEDTLNVRFQLQMHKYIWKPDEKGV